MNRLTFDGNFCDIARCGEIRYGSFCEDGYCSQRKVWERLKHYEDLEEQGQIVYVVRCKDCKHRQSCNLMIDDDFCSDGERKTEAASPLRAI